MEKLISVDIGTTNTKGALLDAQGTVLARHAVRHVMESEQPGWSEHDMRHSWWEASAEIIRRLLADSGADPRSVAAVMVSGMSPSIGLTDEAGNPLRKGITQSDTRRPERALADYGLTPWDHAGVNTYIIPKLLWVGENQPELYASTRRIFFAHSYLSFCLTGNYTIDFNTSCWLSPLFDRERRRYDRAAFDAIGLEHCLLPEVLAPTDLAGTVSPAAAEATGLSTSTKVLVGTGDFYLSLMAAGVREPGDAMLYFGSAGIVIAAAEPVTSFLSKPAQVGMQGDPFLMGPIFPVSGVLLEWFQEGFAGREAAQAAAAGESVFALLDRDAEALCIGAEKLLFLPHLHGERNPDDDPDARGVLYGLNLNHRAAHVYRAIMESYCYAVRHALGEMESRGEIIPIKRFFVSGGGAKSPLWRQMTSDVLDRRQEYYPGGDETLAGAYLAGMGAGLFADEGEFYARWLRDGGSSEPIAANRAQYDRVFEAYRTLYGRLRGSYSMLLRLP